MGEGGCTECHNKPGCEDHKGGMFAAIEGALERLYPDRRWDQRDEEAAFRGGVSRAEGARLTAVLAPRLRAMTLFRPGGAEEYCDYIYVLCVGRPPSIIEIREGAGGPDQVIQGDGADGDGVEELYLRVALSAIVRFAGVQQVTMRMSRDGAGLVITESPRTGVFDPILLGRFQKLVAVLAELDIRHIDFGEILQPPPGYDPGDYAERYSGVPTVANYLFYPQPCSAITTSIVELAAT
jgi:hypothetical protein